MIQMNFKEFVEWYERGSGEDDANMTENVTAKSVPRPTAGNTAKYGAKYGAQATIQQATTEANGERQPRLKTFSRSVRVAHRISKGANGINVLCMSTAISRCLVCTKRCRIEKVLPLVAGCLFVGHNLQSCNAYTRWDDLGTSGIALNTSAPMMRGSQVQTSRDVHAAVVQSQVLVCV